MILLTQVQTFRQLMCYKINYRKDWGTGGRGEIGAGKKLKLARHML